MGAGPGYWILPTREPGEGAGPGRDEEDADQEQNPS